MNTDFFFQELDLIWNKFKFSKIVIFFVFTLELY